MKPKYNCTNYGIFELHLLSDNEQILALLSVIVRKNQTDSLLISHAKKILFNIECLIWHGWVHLSYMHKG